MTSQSPAPPATIKVEESAASEGNAPASELATSNNPNVLSKQELEVMDGVVKRLTEYRDEEYVLD